MGIYFEMTLTSHVSVESIPPQKRKIRYDRVFANSLKSSCQQFSLSIFPFIQRLDRGRSIRTNIRPQNARIGRRTSQTMLFIQTTHKKRIDCLLVPEAIAHHTPIRDGRIEPLWIS